jgi:alkylation response protein AidB-like acyl-CoA dehydrogenase
MKVEPTEKPEANGSLTESPRARAERLTPLIREYADETERERRLAAPVVAALRAEGLLSLGLPASLGGPETPVAAAMRAIEQISYADGATGWNAMIAYDAGLWSAYLSGSGAHSTLASIKQPIIAGSIQPPGRLQRTREGYRLTGQWRFGSGCQQADLFFAAATLYENDQPVLHALGFQRCAW